MQIQTELSQVKTINFEFFLDLQFQQISEETSVNFVMLIYENELDRKPEIFYRQLNYFHISTEMIEQLVSDIYLGDNLEFFKVIHRGNYEDKFIYICPLSQKNFVWEYLLLLCENPLSYTEEKTIETHGQLIQQYLHLYQAYINQSDEIKTLEHLVHKIGHELRNPISIISLIAENLRLTLPQLEHQEKVLSIQQTVSNLNESLNHLLDCGKRARLKLELHDLRDIFIKSVRHFKPILEAKKISVQYPQYKEAIISVDELQIQQVFGNLFSNAIHFSPEGGVITCNWQIFQQEIIVTIVDQGEGLSSQDLKNIFTPFYSRRPGGTGLGLTIVKKIIMDHGGSIWAENLPKRGTKFTFTLPR